MHLRKLVSLAIVFLTACATPATSIADAALPAAALVPTKTLIPSPASTPTFTSASLPDGLVVAYIVDDGLWLWKENHTELLIQQQNIFDPLLSDDGQWLLFKKQRYLDKVLSEEVWVMQTDGDELHRLLGPDELTPLAEDGTILLPHDVRWVPGRHELLFDTQTRIEGPPEWVPVFDLFRLDLSGNITRLVEAGQGGRFAISPDGAYVALATSSRIGILDLESGRQRMLLEFKSIGTGSEFLYIPEVTWDLQSQFVMTSILPQKLYSPEEFAGELVQVWRLYANGQAELVVELQPFVPLPWIAFAPDLQHFFFLRDDCVDGMGMLSVHSVASAEEASLFCVWKLPQWLPDNEHFLYELDGLWQVGSIAENTKQPLDVLNVPADLGFRTFGSLTWIDNEYFLLVLRGDNACTLDLANLQGMVAEITRTSSDACPEIDFGLSK